MICRINEWYDYFYRGFFLNLTLFLTDFVTWYTMRGLIPPSPGRNRVKNPIWPVLLVLFNDNIQNILIFSSDFRIVWKTWLVWQIHDNWHLHDNYIMTGLLFTVELVSKELNHLATILHVYAGGLILMK